MNEKPESRPEAGDERLRQMVRSVAAEPDAVLWTRVRARIVASEAERGAGLWGAFDWLTRPLAVASSAAALVLALGIGGAMSRSPALRSSAASASTSASGELEVATLGDWLLAERETNASEPESSAPAESAGARGGDASGAGPDSGGPS